MINCVKTADKSRRMRIVSFLLSTGLIVITVNSKCCSFQEMAFCFAQMGKEGAGCVMLGMKVQAISNYLFKDFGNENVSGDWSKI